MINRTENEIVKELERIYGEHKHSWDEIEFKVQKHSDKEIRITVSKMYEAPGLSFEMISQLAKFFDTLLVETNSEFSHGGCDTCDYGSAYGYDLYITEGKPFAELQV
jgi:hypothetical protein